METVVYVRGVCKTFRDNSVLRNLDFYANKGDVIGIVGSNGSGKSVFFKLLCGLLKPDVGEIRIRDIRLGEPNDYPESVGILINSPGYIELYSGFDNLKYLAGINKLITEEEIAITMKRVGLDPEDKKKVKNYSTGMKQKLGIAQAIMERQDIIILDEPFNGLDYQSCIDLKELIHELRAEKKTVILTSHGKADLEELCDKIYLLVNGKLELLTGKVKNNYFAAGINESITPLDEKTV